jgi:hypothetical protein
MAILTDVEDIEFVYPSKPWKLPLFCHLWFLSLFAYLYYGHVPDLFSPVYTSTVIGYLVVVSMWLWEWPARFLGAGKPIILSQSGITAIGRFAKWDDIKKIQHGPFFFFRHSVVYLKLKREKKSFFSISIRRRYLPLIGYPFVYEEVLPAILGYRPDVPVSAVVKRNMEAPENSRGLHTWFVLLLLTLYIILLYLISLDDFQTLIYYIIIGAILVLLSTGTSNFAVPFATTNRERFIEFAINNMLLVGVAIKLFPFSTSDYIVMEVLITTAIFVCIMAIIILLTTDKLSALWQVCIIWVIVFSPICVYLYGKSQTWQSRDISHQLEKKDWNIPLWSFSGDYLTCLSYEENGFIIQVPSLKNVSVPEHIGRNRVVWLSNEFLLRTIESNDKIQLWLICHREKYLAWIDFEEDVNNGEVRFWNLKENIEDVPPVSLPPEISWKSGQVVWLDQNKIAVCARIAKQKGKEEGSKLAVLYSNLDGKERRLYVSSKRFGRWYPTMDCQYAFGVNSLEHDKYSVSFVNLTTDASIVLEGEDFPALVPWSNYALRITHNSGQPYLTRFEFNTLKDFPLYRVPDNTKVVTVSKTGKFVLLGLKKDIFTMPVFYVFHVPSGKKHKIHFAGMGVFHSPQLCAIYPGASNFSPNERFLLLNIAQGLDLKLLLYELPGSW